MTCDRQAKSCLACVCSNVASTSSSSSTGDQHDRLCHASAADQDADIGMPITFDVTDRARHRVWRNMMGL
jgi:hypothetical protein